MYVFDNCIYSCLNCDFRSGSSGLNTFFLYIWWSKNSYSAPISSMCLSWFWKVPGYWVMKRSTSCVASFANSICCGTDKFSFFVPRLMRYLSLGNSNCWSEDLWPSFLSNFFFWIVCDKMDSEFLLSLHGEYAIESRLSSSIRRCCLSSSCTCLPLPSVGIFTPAASSTDSFLPTGLTINGFLNGREHPETY